MSTIHVYPECERGCNSYRGKHMDYCKVGKLLNGERTTNNQILDLTKLHLAPADLAYLQAHWQELPEKQPSTLQKAKTWLHYQIIKHDGWLLLPLGLVVAQMVVFTLTGVLLVGSVAQMITGVILAIAGAIVFLVIQPSSND